ncbi:MAG: S-methyl-5'-thioinosine phosphorylase [Candidatus Berkiella sp.]
MNKVAIIGGSRFITLENFAITHSTTVSTPYGEPSAPLNYGMLGGDKEVVFLPRRDTETPTAPHKINFRANIWALRDAGVQTIIATAAIAGITEQYNPGDLVLPDQLIDYTYGRDNTFFGEDHIAQVDFAEPYSEVLRQKIIKKAHELDLELHQRATYGITQGPRFETSAEVKKLAQDGCHVVGMTGMPEAALARELELDYILLGIIVRTAGKYNKTPDMETKVLSCEKKLAYLIEQLILDPVT